MKQAIMYFTKEHINHRPIFHSNRLYGTISILHEVRDYRLKQTVSRIRNSFETRDIYVLRRVQAAEDLADALTKRDVNMHGILKRILKNGLLELPNHRDFQLDSKS